MNRPRTRSPHAVVARAQPTITPGDASSVETTRPEDIRAPTVCGPAVSTRVGAEQEMPACSEVRPAAVSRCRGTACPDVPTRCATTGAAVARRPHAITHRRHRDRGAQALRREASAAPCAGHSARAVRRLRRRWRAGMPLRLRHLSGSDRSRGGRPSSRRGTSAAVDGARACAGTAGMNGRHPAGYREGGRREPMRCPVVPVGVG